MLMRALTSSLLAVSLAFSGVGPVASQAWASQKTASRDSLLQARLRTLSLAVDFASEAPDTAERRLEQALESLHTLAPEVAASREARKEQRNAGLVLARTQIYNQRPTQAQRTLRELFLIDPPKESEFSAFGPSLTEQAKLARAHVDGLTQGVVEIDCASSCAAYLNERRIPLVGNVPLGEYRLYIEDLAGNTPPLQERLELRGNNAKVRVSFKNQTVQSERSGSLMTPAPTQDVLAPRQPLPADTRRVAPMWLEITGATLGAGMIAAGSVLVTKKRKICEKRYPDGSCRKDRSYKEPGIGLLIGGGALFITSTILLIVDGKRGSKKKKREKIGRLLQGELRF